MIRSLIISSVVLAGLLFGISLPAHADAVATDSKIVGFGGKCLDLPYGNLQNGTDLHMWDCNGTNNQLWSSQNKFLKLRHHCMDGEGPTRDWGTPAQIWDCAFGATNQRWTMTVAGEIISNYSGQCLDVFAWDKSNGADVVLWPCNGQGNQKWILKDAPNRKKQCNGRYIESVLWDFTDKGLVLRVEPTTYGRQAAKLRNGSAWKEVVACKPSRYSSWSFDSVAVKNLENQFNCHADLSVGAFGKYSGGSEWDLESYNRLEGKRTYFGTSTDKWCGNQNPVRLN